MYIISIPNLYRANWRSIPYLFLSFFPFVLRSPYRNDRTLQIEELTTFFLSLCLSFLFFSFCLSFLFSVCLFFLSAVLIYLCLSFGSFAFLSVFPFVLRSRYKDGWTIKIHSFFSFFHLSSFPFFGPGGLFVLEPT